LFNSRSHQKPAHFVSIDSVIVSKQIGGLYAKGHRFPQLLDNPRHRRMSRHSEVHHLAARVIQNDKDIKDLKAKGRNGEEVHPPRHRHMITQEGQPGLGLVSSSRQLDHVLPDGVRVGWIEPQQQQMSVDCFCAPQDILTTQTSDQCPHVWADRRSASFPPRFPPPPVQKGILPPLENRLGFHQCWDKLPSTPHPGQQNPEQAESWIEPRAGMFLLPDTFFVEGQLTSESDEFTSE
jgi:hypothetical protein